MHTQIIAISCKVWSWVICENCEVFNEDIQTSSKRGLVLSYDVKKCDLKEYAVPGFFSVSKKAYFFKKRDIEINFVVHKIWFLLAYKCGILLKNEIKSIVYLYQ